MVSIELDMIQSAGLGALALLVGMALTRKVAFLQKFCVPSPVSGGIIFSCWHSLPALVSKATLKY